MTTGYTYTLGGARLLALRKRVGKTQLVVEADAGLGSGYMQRIESGKVRQPERATLERILAALDARYNERREILALFGYLVPVPLPDENEIAWARDIAHEDLDGVPFPAYLLDCGIRLLAWNRCVPRLFSVVKHESAEIFANHWSMFRLWFDPRYGVTERICNPDTFFAQMLRAFRHELHLIGEELWCAAMIVALLRDMPLFRTHWERSDAPQTASAARALVPLQLRANGDILQFRVSAEPFTHDARFRIVYLLPADPFTMQQCARWAAFD